MRHDYGKIVNQIVAATGWTYATIYALTIGEFFRAAAIEQAPTLSL